MSKKFLTLLSLLLVGALLAACSSLPASAQAQPTLPPIPSPQPGQDSTPRTVSVTGSGKATLTPDIAYINIGVHTEGKDAAQAVSDNSTSSQKVVAAIKSFGIDAKDIKTTNFSIYPQQQYDPQGKPTGAINYVVDNSVYVTVRDLSKIGNLLNTVVTSGANAINGIQFDVSDKTQALSGARKAAVEDARAQAAELAQAAGATLGPVQTISANVSSNPIPMMYESKAALAQGAAADVPVSAGELTVSVQVSVVFELR